MANKLATLISYCEKVDFHPKTDQKTQRGPLPIDKRKNHKEAITIINIPKTNDKRIMDHTDPDTKVEEFKFLCHTQMLLIKPKSAKNPKR